MQYFIRDRSTKTARADEIPKYDRDRCTTAARADGIPKP